MSNWIKPRHIKTKVSSYTKAQASCWYYRREHRDEVTIEVRDRDGNHIATVLVDIRHPRRV